MQPTPVVNVQPCFSFSKLLKQSLPDIDFKFLLRPGEEGIACNRARDCMWTKELMSYCNEVKKTGKIIVIISDESNQNSHTLRLLKVTTDKTTLQNFLAISTKLNIFSSYDPTIPFRDICPTSMCIWVHPKSYTRLYSSIIHHHPK